MTVTSSYSLFRRRPLREHAPAGLGLVVETVADARGHAPSSRDRVGDHARGGRLWQWVLRAPGGPDHRPRAGLRARPREALLEECTRLAEKQGIENVVPVHGDARSLARHLPEPVDVVLLANAFHGVEDRSGVVREAFDALGSDGQFVVVNWRDLPRSATTVEGEPCGPPADLRMSPDETETVVLDAVDGTLTGHVNLPPYHYALVFER